MLAATALEAYQFPVTGVALRWDGQVVTAEEPETGVVQLKLSNGVAINFRRSVNEPQAAMIRMVASGGRACEGALRRPPPPPRCDDKAAENEDVTEGWPGSAPSKTRRAGHVQST